MSSTNSIFTGSSSYSQDFQNLITRAVSIASLPLTQLNNQQTALSKQSNELSTLATQFSALQSSVQSVDSALSSSFTATNSASSVVAVSTSSGAVPGAYSILVSDAGAYSSMLSATWTGTSNTSGSYQLSIGQTSYDINPADDSAASVAAAINANYGDKVQATVVNVGTSDVPDYRLSLQSTNLTDSVLDLKQNGVSLADVQTPGAPAQYEIDGSGQTVKSDSRTVNVATGVTLTILDKSATAVNISVTRSTAGLGSALSGFANAYNAIVTELSAQRGSSAGPLAGDSIVLQLSSLLSGIATYTGNGLSGIADLGIDLGADGKLTFDQTALDATQRSNSAGLASFLGSASSGGFLKAATDTLTAIQDSTTGILAASQSSLKTQITNITNSINDKQDQIDKLQTRLQTQMSAADAAIAAMQQQYSYMSNMFQAMQTASQQNK